MDNLVKLVECPRESWESLPHTVPAEVKADYLKLLVTAGFRHMDVASFVSQAEVPQMADSEQVLEMLEPPSDVEILALAFDRSGADRAIATGAVTTLAFPYSLSAEYLQQRQRQTPEESLESLDQVGEAAYRSGTGVMAYLTMAFGNPFGEPWDEEEVAAACELLADNGVDQVTLVDSTGAATPERIVEVFAAAFSALPEGVELGLQLCTQPEAAAHKIASAWHSGCRRLHTVLGGSGLSHFGSDAMAGNLATEVAVEELTRLGARLPELSPLDSLLLANRAIAQKFGQRVQ